MKKRRLLFALITSLLLSGCDFDVTGFFNSKSKPEEEKGTTPSEVTPPPGDTSPVDPVDPVDPETPVDPVDPPSGDDDSFNVIKTFEKRMPAEFEPVKKIKMCYPNNMPLSVYKTIAEDNKILLLVNRSQSGSSRISQATTDLNNAGVNMQNVSFLDMDLDNDYEYWVRDFSPFYVFNNLSLILHIIAQRELNKTM